MMTCDFKPQMVPCGAAAVVVVESARAGVSYGARPMCEQHAESLALAAVGLAARRGETFTMRPLVEAVPGA